MLVGMLVLTLMLSLVLIFVLAKQISDDPEVVQQKRVSSEMDQRRWQSKRRR